MNDSSETGSTEQPEPEPPVETPPAPEPEPEPEPQPEEYTELIEAGQWAMAISDYTTAIMHFKKAYRQEPLFTEVNYLLGKAYRASGDVNKAIDHLKIALKQNPDDANSLLEIAYSYESTGDKTTAIDYFEKFLTLKDRDDIRKHVEDLRD